MRVAITGGTGFVGRHLAKALVARGHEVILIARGRDQRDPSAYKIPNTRFFAADLSSVEEVERAFAACGAVAHCAGINREIGPQTYQRIQIEGTRNVVEAARRAGVGKITLLSFLRARPNCGSGYHESKWAAEEIVRGAGLDCTIFKAGVIYGRGDHMLDHLSHAMHTFPVFGLVGFADKPVRPLAVEDLAGVLCAALTEGRLSRQTVAIMGPEQMPLSEAVKRVGRVAGKRPLYVPLPIAMHQLLAALFEATMKIPLVSKAQVRILSEGIVEPWPPYDTLPTDLTPKTPFSDEQIRRGLPEAKSLGVRDLRCSA
ncbi:MAG TPA: NAD-dependent epimerase/dehydratase family protein [Candidatus Limnocylindrales bacterium]|nr:NAD-dependent epimerase/dehydratase family protein [Candidatus Limnocylindrales bacterium]